MGKRPVNLNLFTIKFPLPAIVSILHRASGALVFLLIPLLLWMLQASLKAPVQFDDLQDTLNNFFVKLIIWLLVSALLYHLVAGIRHLLMDLGLGESLRAARFSAWLVMIISGVLVVITGGWLWLT